MENIAKNSVDLWKTQEKRWTFNKQAIKRSTSTEKMKQLISKIIFWTKKQVSTFTSGTQAGAL